MPVKKTRRLRERERRRGFDVVTGGAGLSYLSDSSCRRAETQKRAARRPLNRDAAPRFEI